MVSIFSSVSIKETAFTPHFNTGTHYDSATGVFVPGHHGGMIMNGGLTSTNATVGREQMFKSTEAISKVLFTLIFYPDTDCIIYDTEFAQKIQRLLKFIPESLRKGIEERIRIIKTTDYTPEEVFKLIIQIGKMKLEHKKDFTEESPFTDIKGEKIKILRPTIVVFDSWTKMNSTKVVESFEKVDVGSSDQNMVFMTDGKMKTLMMSQLPVFAVKYGFIFVLTAHIGDKMDLNPYAATPKDLQHMKGSDKIKGVGADFTFLISNLSDTRKVELLLDSNKKCLYPIKNGSDVELSELTTIIARNKNNVSGSICPFVVSQYEGIRTSLSFYHYLRNHDYYGLNGNKQDHELCIYPGEKLSRTTIRVKTDSDPKLRRGLEIVSQFKYIKDNWNLSLLDVDFTIDINKFAEGILGKDGLANDILESRGFWTYDKENTTPYLSVYDIVAIVTGKYESKYFNLGQKKDK